MWHCSSRLPHCACVTRSNPEEVLEEARRGRDRLRVGALLVFVLRHREAVAGAAVELHLELDLGLAQLVVDLSDLLERIGHIFGAVQDQELAFDILRPARGMAGERAVDCNDRGERRAVEPKSTPTMPPKQ